MPLIIGLDFGTSNTSAAVLRDGRPEVLQLEPGQAVLPTAIFLDYTTRATLYGSDAVAAMMIEYSSAPRSSSTLTNCATVERFWPTAT